MSQGASVASAAASESNASDLYWLLGTLKDYDVEELSGHELGRLLPEVLLAMRRRRDAEAEDLALS
jgi:hypothetical protein